MLYMLTDINIGISPEMCHTKRQGIVHFADHNGDVHRQPFLVDKPARVEKPSANTLELLFDQIRKMGYTPVSLEFINERRHATYKPDIPGPVFYQPLQH